MTQIPIPPEVMDAALAVAYPNGYEQMTANVEGAVEHVVAWLAKEYRLDDPRHLVRVDPDGWTIQHPAACRPNLFTCPWSDGTNLTVGQALDQFEPEPARHGHVYEGQTTPDPRHPGTVRLILVGEPVDVGPTPT